MTSDFSPITLPEGMVFDYITNRPVKDSAKEQVRQRTAHAIPKEFGISLADMTIDFPIAVGGRKRKADIVVFSHGTEHTLENVQRVVLVKPEPTKRSAAGLRSHEQAEGDLRELEEMLAATPNARYGMWTNGTELFFLERHSTKFEERFEPIADWPMGDESLSDQNFASVQRVMLQGFLPKMPQPLGGLGKLEELYGKAAQNLVARSQGRDCSHRSQRGKVHRRAGSSTWSR